MKAFRTLLSVVVLGTMIAFSGCGGGGGNTEPVTDKQLGLLSKAWKVNPNGGVLFGSGLNQVDSTSNWVNRPFILTITGTKGQTVFNYTCTGRPPRSVWPASGTWSFTSNPTTGIVRDPGTSGELNISYSLPSSTSLQLVISGFTGSGYTRTENVSGDWTFNLIPN
jgi:hypothetical protein